MVDTTCDASMSVMIYVDYSKFTSFAALVYISSVYYLKQIRLVMYFPFSFQQLQLFNNMRYYVRTPMRIRLTEMWSYTRAFYAGYRAMTHKARVMYARALIWRFALMRAEPYSSRYMSLTN